jgi:hypothetical protein
MKCHECNTEMIEDSDSFETWNGYRIEVWEVCPDCSYSPDNKEQ